VALKERRREGSRAARGERERSCSVVPDMVQMQMANSKVKGRSGRWAEMSPQEMAKPSLQPGDAEASRHLQNLIYVKVQSGACDIIRALLYRGIAI
jgi:hypothetical protein